MAPRVATIDPQFVAILDPVVTTDAQTFPAISVWTIGIDLAFPGAMGTRSTVIDVRFIAIFHAIIAA